MSGKKNANALNIRNGADWSDFDGNLISLSMRTLLVSVRFRSFAPFGQKGYILLRIYGSTGPLAGKSIQFIEFSNFIGNGYPAGSFEQHFNPGIRM